jgi:hypothetical protein
MKKKKKGIFSKRKESIAKKGLHDRDRLIENEKKLQQRKARSEKVIEVVSEYSIGNARKRWSRFKSG